MSRSAKEDFPKREFFTSAKKRHGHQVEGSIDSETETETETEAETDFVALIPDKKIWGQISWGPAYRQRPGNTHAIPWPAQGGVGGTPQTERDRTLGNLILAL